MSLLAERDEGAKSGRQLSAAMSYEGMADELSFVGGPVLVGALATLVGPVAPVLASAGLTLVAVIAFAWHPTAVMVRPRTTPVVRRPSSRMRGASLLRSSVLLPVGGMLFMGGFFGAALISLTEFMGERGAPAQTGLVFGCIGVSSAVFAALMTRVPERITLRARWLASALVILCSSIAMVLVGPVWAMCLVLVLGGAAAGQVLVTLNTLGAAAAPPQRFATTMILLSSGITVGQALAAALAGAAAEYGGFAAAVVGAVVCAGAGVLVAAASNLRPTAQ